MKTILKIVLSLFLLLALLIGGFFVFKAVQIGQMSINRALYWSHPSAERRLPRKLANGADPNEPGADGLTAMHWAGWFGSGENMRLLIEAGGDVHRKDDLGQTPIFFAAGNLKDNGA